MSEPTLSAAAVRRIEQHYEQLKNELLELGWISQGSLMRQLPNAWRWTYKVKTKTVTVALSKEQAELYQKVLILAPFTSDVLIVGDRLFRPMPTSCRQGRNYSLAEWPNPLG